MHQKEKEKQLDKRFFKSFNLLIFQSSLVYPILQGLIS